MSESYAGKINRKLLKKRRIINAAAGREPADLVLKNATYVNVFSNELCHADIAVAEGLIVGMGQYSGTVEEDCTGKIVLPGFLDAHIHLESSLVSPKEFVKAVLPHGTTTVITDPHEIANVMGTDGIEYMLQATEDLPVDVRFMLPSCVPATPLDESGAVLDYRAIDSFYDHPRVQGLAEMMNFVGIIAGDDQPVEKIVAAQAHHKKIDGHAPDLVGNDLNAYIAAGVYSDHECSRPERRHRQAGAGPVHHDPGGHRRPESGRPGPPAVRQILRAVHVLHRRQAPQRPAGKRPHRLHRQAGHRPGGRPHHRREGAGLSRLLGLVNLSNT